MEDNVLLASEGGIAILLIVARREAGRVQKAKALWRWRFNAQYKQQVDSGSNNKEQLVGGGDTPRKRRRTPLKSKVEDAAVEEAAVEAVTTTPLVSSKKMMGNPGKGAGDENEHPNRQQHDPQPIPPTAPKSASKPRQPLGNLPTQARRPSETTTPRKVAFVDDEAKNINTPRVAKSAAKSATKDTSPGASSPCNVTREAADRPADSPSGVARDLFARRASVEDLEDRMAGANINEQQAGANINEKPTFRFESPPTQRREEVFSPFSSLSPQISPQAAAVSPSTPEEQKGAFTGLLTRRPLFPATSGSSAPRAEAPGTPSSASALLGQWRDKYKSTPQRHHQASTSRVTPASSSNERPSGNSRPSCSSSEWRCELCYASNRSEKSQCALCHQLKPRNNNQP